MKFLTIMPARMVDASLPLGASLPSIGLAGEAGARVVLVGVLAGPFLIWFLFSLFARKSEAARRAAGRRAADARASRLAQVEQAERVLERVRQVITSVVVTHRATLVMQRSRTLRVDVYGNIIRQRWDAELLYFSEKVVTPALLAELGRDDYARITRYVFMKLNEVDAAQMSARCSDSASQDCFVEYVKALVDDGLGELEPVADIPVLDRAATPWE